MKDQGMLIEILRVGEFTPGVTLDHLDLEAIQLQTVGKTIPLMIGGSTLPVGSLDCFELSADGQALLGHLRTDYQISAGLMSTQAPQLLDVRVVAIAKRAGRQREG